MNKIQEPVLLPKQESLILQQLRKSFTVTVSPACNTKPKLSCCNKTNRHIFPILSVCSTKSNGPRVDSSRRTDVRQCKSSLTMFLRHIQALKQLKEAQHVADVTNCILHGSSSTSWCWQHKLLQSLSRIFAAQNSWFLEAKKWSVLFICSLVSYLFSYRLPPTGQRHVVSGVRWF